MRRRAAFALALILAIAGLTTATVSAAASMPSSAGIDGVQASSPAAPADDTSVTTDAARNSGSQPVYRFWSSKFNNAHFYTVSLSEAQSLHSTDRNWAYEGLDFRVWPVANGKCQPGTTPTHRFWSSKFGSHFFTTSSDEAQNVRASDRNWSYEGVAFCTTESKADTKPVYRFWSAKFGKHFYTANGSEASNLRWNDPDWKFEGVAWRSPNSGRSVQEPTAPREPYGYSCPAGYPIKGNHSSSGEWIYHVPGGAYYDRTKPEECFATERDARAAGYRASKL